MQKHKTLSDLSHEDLQKLLEASSEFELLVRNIPHSIATPLNDFIKDLWQAADIKLGENQDE